MISTNQRQGCLTPAGDTRRSVSGSSDSGSGESKGAGSSKQSNSAQGRSVLKDPHGLSSKASRHQPHQLRTGRRTDAENSGLRVTLNRYGNSGRHPSLNLNRADKRPAGRVGPVFQKWNVGRVSRDSHVFLAVEERREIFELREEQRRKLSGLSPYCCLCRVNPSIPQTVDNAQLLIS